MFISTFVIKVMLKMFPSTKETSKYDQKLIKFQLKILSFGFKKKTFLRKQHTQKYVENNQCE